MRSLLEDIIAKLVNENMHEVWMTTDYIQTVSSKQTILKYVCVTLQQLGTQKLVSFC